MALTRREFLYAAPSLGALSSIVPAQSDGRAEDLWSLWYRQPAKRWLDALPIGNGRLGAMVFGGVEHEVLALNEATVWSGSPNESEVNPSNREYLDEMRRLLFEGRYAEGNALCAKYLSGREGSYGTHLPLANLHIDDAAPAAAANYRRALNLATGLARIEYSLGDRQFLSEAFVSNPDNVLVVRLSCNRPGQISCTVGLDPGDLPGEVRARDGNTLILMSSVWEKKHSDGHVGVNCQAWVRILHQGGTVQQSGSTLAVQNADETLLLITVNTSYGGNDFASACEKQIQSAAQKSYALLRDRHIADHRKLYRRVTVDLGGSEAARKPTDERLAAVAGGESDPHLSALFFQYGRYLLIAGSHENSPLPLNLQGIWNDNLAANMVWTCDFHLDINTQQNYWPTEDCHLPECGEPLFKLVESLSRQGQQTARDMYGTRGWVCHVYTNAWGLTAPGRACLGVLLSPVAFGWLPICGSTTGSRATMPFCRTGPTPC